MHKITLQLALALWVFLIGYGGADVQANSQKAMDMNDEDLISFLKTYTSEHYPGRTFNEFLYVSLDSQCMYRIIDWEITDSYVISGAKLGPGNISGSQMTPLGLHSIAEKYGNGVPLGGILKSRIYTKRVATIYTDKTDVDEDYVTTRILWLKGEEPGINEGKDSKGRVVDSYKRYIYIHGTPEEGLLGTPASHGCIRMVNAAVVDLYEKTEKGTYVLILDQ